MRSDSYSRFARGFGFFRFRKLVSAGLYIECNVSLLDVLDALLTVNSRVFAILKISSNPNTISDDGEKLGIPRLVQIRHVSPKLDLNHHLAAWLLVSLRCSVCLSSWIKSLTELFS